MRQKVKPRVVVSDSMAEFFRAGGYSSDVERFLFTDDKGVVRSDWKVLCEELVADYVNRLPGTRLAISSPKQLFLKRLPLFVAEKIIRAWTRKT